MDKNSRGWCWNRDVHRIFSGEEGQKKFRGGARVGKHFPLSKTSVKNWHFFTTFTQNLLKLPPNEVKDRNRTGERSEPRKFFGIWVLKTHFLSIFLRFSREIYSIFIGEHFLGSNFRGGGQCPTCPPLLCTSLCWNKCVYCFF